MTIEIRLMTPAQNSENNSCLH